MDPSTAQVIVAIITAAAAVVVAVIGVQLKVHRDNRGDHAETAGKVDRILDNQATIQHDVQVIRSDVSDIHGTITELRRSDRDTDGRVTRLERHHHEDGDDAA